MRLSVPIPGCGVESFLKLTRNDTNLLVASSFSPYTQGAVVPGMLRAFDAQNVSRELWNSEQVRARDAVGQFARFCPPTVANGKVCLATFYRLRH